MASNFWTWSSEMLNQSEAAVKLMFSQVAAYPIMCFYRLFLRRSGDLVQNIYFSLSGASLAYCAIGEDAILHSTVAMSSTYLLIRCFGGSLSGVCASFCFNIGYLLLGYYFVDTSSYDYSWTLPHCVLCLKLIGLSFDVWDGSKPWAELSDYQKQNGIRGQMPTLLEVLSYGFFPGGYFFGPVFSLQRYRNMMEVNRQLQQLPSPLLYGTKRLALGVVYICVYVAGKNYLGEAYDHPQLFSGRGFFYQTFWLWVWYKTVLSSYCGAFLISEGACIYAGLGYNGIDEQTNQVLWNATENVNVWLLEFGCHKLHQLIECFNMQTNRWSAEYIYKRLRFLDMRLVSQMATLTFLAVWHGLHGGYYLLFLNEFLLVNLERPTLSLLEDWGISRWVMALPGAGWIAHIVGWLYVNTLLPYAFVPFPLLETDRFWSVLQAQKFCLYKYIVCYFVAIMAVQLTRRLF